MHPLLTRYLGSGLNSLAHVAPNVAAQLGFGLFCQTPPRRLKPHQRAWLASAHSFELSDGRDRIQGYRWGQGPLRVLLTHGWGSNSYFWRKLIDGFSPEEFTFISYDAPGHGLSGGRWLHLPRNGAVLKRVVAHEGPVEAAVGHSFGAFTTLYCAGLEVWQGLERIALLACPGRVADYLDYFKGVLELSPQTTLLINRHCERQLGYPVEWFNAADFARGLSVPGLILHDPADAEAPFAHAQRMAQGWPEATLIEMPGAGHHLRTPEAIEHLRRFVSGEPRSTAKPVGEALSARA